MRRVCSNEMRRLLTQVDQGLRWNWIRINAVPVTGDLVDSPKLNGNKRITYSWRIDFYRQTERCDGSQAKEELYYIEMI